MPVLLLDAYNLLFRSFASLPSAITGADDLPINAVYGILAFIVREIRDREPEHVVAAFDVPDVPTFRRLRYDGYQSQRGPLGGENADDFQRQVAIALDLLPRLGIPVAFSAGFEADDVIGTLAVELANLGGEVLAVSTDRDLLQLVRPGIGILVPGKQGRLIADAEAVQDRMGVPPSGITSFKALAGDASDNIPGLPGIGSKTASALVNRHENLDAIYASLDELPHRHREILSAGKETAYLFCDIATIRIDVPGVSAAGLPRPEVSGESRPRELLKEYG